MLLPTRLCGLRDTGREAGYMRKHLANLEWFLLWSVAFYATALAYAFDARGANSAAMAAVAVAVAALGCCMHTAIAQRLGHRR
jgi:hypothetical protein